MPPPAFALRLHPARFALGVTAALVMSLVALSCGNRSDTPTPAASATTGTPTATTAATQLPGSPTPLPTPLVPPPSDESDPWAFANWLDQSLRAGDVAPFLVRARTDELTCDANNSPPRYTLGPCKRAGEVLHVFPVSLFSSTADTAPTQYLQLPELNYYFRVLVDDAPPAAADDYGSSQARVFAYYQFAPQRLSVVITAITSGGRTTDLTHWQWDGAGEWVLTEASRTTGPRAPIYLDPRLGIVPDSWTRFDPAGPPATPTPVVPRPSFTGFVAEAAAAVGSLDPQSFVDRIEPRRVLCTGANTPGQGIGAPPCVTVGENLQVITWNHGLEGGYVTLDDAATNFRRWFEQSLPGASDEYGPGELRVFAFYDQGGEGRLALTAILSPEGSGYTGPHRTVITFGFRYTGDGWRLIDAGTPFYPDTAAWFALAGDEFTGWQTWP